MSATAESTLDTAELRLSVSGPVLLPQDEGFAAEVAAFNLAVTHHPAVAVGVTSAADISAAVRWAAARGLPIAVQATGHGATMPADGAVLISTRRMTSVSVDPAARTAVVGAGARWRDVLAVATPHGLATLNGSSSDVGVVGFLTGGGLPILGRAFGWSADLVRSVELVTPDGVVRHLSADSEPELFWAVRGGKGNVGVVASVEIELLPISTLYGGAIFFPGDAAPALLHAWREWVRDLPEEMCSSIALLRLPDLPDVLPPLAGKLTVHLRVAYVGSAAEGERLLAPMRAVAPAIMDAVAEMPYSQVDEIHHDPTAPVPAWEKGLLLDSLPAEAVDAVLAVAGPEQQVPLVLVEVRHLGGALSREPAVANAVCGRGAAFSVWTLGVLAPPIAAVVPSVGGAVLAALAPWAFPENALNFIGACSSPDEVATAWCLEDRARLQAIKGKVDPQNLLRIGSCVQGTPA